MEAEERRKVVGSTNHNRMRMQDSCPKSIGNEEVLSPPFIPFPKIS